MALIGKIRKNFWFVLILLGLALAAFILMDAQGSNGPGGAVRSMTMGKVAGQKISYQDFSQTEQAYYRNSNTDVFQKRKSIWDFYVENAVLQNEADDLGLTVSTEELMDLQFGPNPSPVIQSNWRNPQTGQLDVASLQQFRTSIESGEQLKPEFEAYWVEQQKQIIKDAIQTKLTTLVNKGIYSPTWLAEENYKIENDKADFNYVKIPYENIDGSGIELSETDYKDYMTKYKSLYEEKEETRVANFAVVNVLPSEQDKADMRENLELLKTEFERTDNDSLFAIGNKGSYSYLYATKDQLPESAREQVANLNPGETYGPFEENGMYLILKLLDKRVVADSVSARHILRNGTDAASIAIADAYIDSLWTVYKRGRASFADLATEHSEDQGSKINGGDLGSFTQSTMVREFGDVCFLTGRKGGVYKVKTQYGVHLIKIEEQQFLTNDDKYRVASISQTILPSQTTQDEAYDLASELVSKNNNIESLKAAAEASEKINFEFSPPLKKNDHAVGSLGSGQVSRDMVLWMFDPSTNVGDVSPQIYRYTDPVNYYDNKYVITALEKVVSPGLKSVDSVRDQIEVAVMNQKKGEKFAASLNVTSLADVASQNSVEVATAANVSLSNSFVQGVGTEPDVVGAAYNLAPQSVSKPIVGTSGVFVVSPLSVVDAGAPTNLPLLKSNASSAAKSQTTFKIIQNLKERANIKDDRSTFF